MYSSFPNATARLAYSVSPFELQENLEFLQEDDGTIWRGGAQGVGGVNQVVSGPTAFRVPEYDPGFAALRTLGPNQLIALGSGFTLITNTGYWVYQGFIRTAKVINFVRFNVTAGGTGAQTAEICLASSPLPPNRATQSLTPVAGGSSGTLGALTGTGILANTGALACTVPAGTHLWAGIRAAMATTQPAIAALANDSGVGAILSTATPGVLTGAGPFSGTVPAQAFTAQGPNLIATVD